MDGLTACQRIIERLGDAAPPIVALTASCSSEEKSRCTAAGMSAFLSKPVRAAQMGTMHEASAAACASIR